MSDKPNIITAADAAKAVEDGHRIVRLLEDLSTEEKRRAIVAAAMLLNIEVIALGKKASA